MRHLVRTRLDRADSAAERARTRILAVPLMQPHSTNTSRSRNTVAVWKRFKASVHNVRHELSSHHWPGSSHVAPSGSAASNHRGCLAIDEPGEVLLPFPFAEGWRMSGTKSQGAKGCLPYAPATSSKHRSALSTFKRAFRTWLSRLDLFLSALDVTILSSVTITPRSDLRFFRSLWKPIVPKVKLVLLQILCCSRSKRLADIIVDQLVQQSLLYVNSVGNQRVQVLVLIPTAFGITLVTPDHSNLSIIAAGTEPASSYLQALQLLQTVYPPQQLNTQVVRKLGSAALTLLTINDFKMQSKRLATAAVFPALVSLVNALSFANFQQITSASIPIKCQLKYDATISSCTVADFQDLCSAACINGLNTAAQTVVNACGDVEVSAATLLGILLNGNQIGALCPSNKKSKTTTSTAKTSAAATRQSVTLETSGVQPSTTARTSSKPPSFTTTASTIPFSTIPPISSVLTFTSIEDSTSVSETIISVPSTTAVSIVATTTPLAQTTSTTSKKDSATSSSTTRSKPTSQGRQPSLADTGGGSPFDPQGAASSLRVGSTLSMLLLSAWTGFFILR
ncbi:hypothetical protein BP6252_00757 [Coleophoma cylindrospora]|uniref:Uncharacterized protein n=1 Tax=Coleophoma cylindrospora TaxID=1849047 RepID=A0A3D8SQY9_9HELO|nr:hypothetical protein BP6252_00757 [Coleophoma cylindrospora]